MKPIRYFLAASLALASGSLLAQAYPNRPVTLVVPFAAGGPTDVVARSLGQAMTRTLGQSVVIENKLGAGGTLAADYVAKAAPDGYTVLIHHNGMATAPALYRKLPFNPLTDFEYVSQVVDVPMTLLGRKDLPPNNLGRADHLRQGERRQAQPGACRPGRGVAPLRHGVPPGGRRRAADRALPGHGAGAQRAARRPGRPALRPDDADHPAHQGRHRQALRRDDPEPHQRPAPGADPGRAGTEGLPGRRLARHLRAEGNAGAGDREAPGRRARAP